ncbi:MAG: hypothetical protein M3N47_10855 [Chloroflexota bacterium]|nr:hypothetical protein [Chloroflexota bacterium]
MCDDCKHPVDIPAAVMRANGFVVEDDLSCFEPVGCGRCSGSGYRGRIGLYEVMWVSDTIRTMAVARETTEAIAWSPSTRGCCGCARTASRRSGAG